MSLVIPEKFQHILQVLNTNIDGRQEIAFAITAIRNPRHYKIPDWFLNRQKDVKDGKYSQVLAKGLDNKFREEMELGPTEGCTTSGDLVSNACTPRPQGAVATSW
ncbi:hypothetical protein GH733_014443, partial [Mirounga leonina]